MDKMLFFHNFPPEFPLLYAVKYEFKKYNTMDDLCARDWRERKLGELVMLQSGQNSWWFLDNQLLHTMWVSDFEPVIS